MSRNRSSEGYRSGRQAPGRLQAGARRGLVIALLVAAVVLGTACAAGAQAERGSTPPGSGEPGAAAQVLAAPSGPTATPRPLPDGMAAYEKEIPHSVLTLEMVPVPGGTLTLPGPDGPYQAEIAPFYLERTELPWEVYDLYLFGLEKGAAAGNAELEAISRPSMPYTLPGENFGHQGHPALSMRAQAAQQFAQWISALTGTDYRLPTEDEWEYACLLGQDPAQPLDEAVWYAANAGEETHEVGSLAADRLGLHDMRGHVAEWVVGRDGELVVKGGSFLSDADAVDCLAREVYHPDWQMRDPQLPKSTWWLSDAPFLGMRLARDAP